MKDIKTKLLEVFGDREYKKLIEKSPAYITLHINNNTRTISRILELCDEIADNSYITNNRFYWFFEDIDEAEDSWTKIQRIVSQKAQKTIDGERVSFQDGVCEIIIK